MVNLLQVVDVLETLYPLELSESWDHPGLVVGDLRAQVRRIGIAVDPSPAVVHQALVMNLDLLITHHPLLFRAVHHVSAADWRGQIIHDLYRQGCALWVGHTNADSAVRGVGYAAAVRLGLHEHHPMQPIQTKSPQADVGETGLGRIGQLARPQTLRAFAHTVATVLPKSTQGVLVSGDLDAMVHTVAVLPGSGDSMIDMARDLGAQVYVTSDLRHHPATDAYAESVHKSRLAQLRGAVNHDQSGAEPSATPAMALINTPHSAIESLWCDVARADIAQALLTQHEEHCEVVCLDQAYDIWDLRLDSPES